MEPGAIHRENCSSYGSPIAHKLRRFTVAHKHGMWLVLFNSWSNVRTRTGLNRHRRGYATKEAGSAVHFPASGPIGLAQSQFLISIFHHHYYGKSSGVASFLKAHEYQKYSTSIGSIALSKIYDPIILVIREISRNGSIKPTTCI